MQSVLRDASEIFEDVEVTIQQPTKEDEEKFSKRVDGWVKPSKNSESKKQSDSDIIAKEEPQLPRITPEMLPSNISEWVRDVCERIESPFEIGVVTALTLIGSLIGNKVGIRPKQKDNWTEFPNLWGMIIGDPSIKKTPVYKEMYKAVAKLEADENRAYNEKAEVYNTEMELYKNKKKELLKNEDLEALQELTEPERPKHKRYATGDGTIEAIADILKNNPNGLLVARDELDGFLKSMDKQGREGDRTFYLEGWSNGSFTVDRIGRGHSFIPKLTLSVLGNIQPSIIQRYVYEAVQGHKADGFLQRFQLTVFAEAQELKGVDRYPNKEAKDRFYNTIESIAKADFFRGSNQDEFSDSRFYRFETDAQSIFNEWYLKNAKEASNAFNDALKGHLSKYPKLFTSLALIFHICELAETKEEKYNNSISRTNTQRAYELVEVLKAHAYKLYSTYELQEAKKDERADNILKYIDANTLPVYFRDVTHKVNGKPSKKEISEAIKGIYKFAGSQIVSKYSR